MHVLILILSGFDKAQNVLLIAQGYELQYSVSAVLVVLQSYAFLGFDFIRVHLLTTTDYQNGQAKGILQSTRTKAHIEYVAGAPSCAAVCQLLPPIKLYSFRRSRSSTPCDGYNTDLEPGPQIASWSWKPYALHPLAA